MAGICAAAAVAVLCCRTVTADLMDADSAKAGKIPAGTAVATMVLVFAASGSDLRMYELDVDHSTLLYKSSISLPLRIQSVGLHPAGNYIYVAWSDGTGDSGGSRHGLSALRVDIESGTLVGNGPPVALPSRPIYVTTDPTARFVLVTYTVPSGISVHRIATDGKIGMPIAQAPLELGIYGHQAVVNPSSTLAIMVARGNLPDDHRDEDPGALNILAWENGQLTNRATIAPNYGIGFHPRYVDFHPSKPWLYVSLSQQNAVGVYEVRPDGTVDAEHLYIRTSLADAQNIRSGQLAGALHLHPNGRYAYLANRAIDVQTINDKHAFNGGENSIAVFEIDQLSGEPNLIHVEDTRGKVPAEFALDPSGKVLVVANRMHAWIRDEGALTQIEPNLAIFRVRDDGTLEFIRTYDIESGDRTLSWVGIGPLR